MKYLLILMTAMGISIPSYSDNTFDKTLFEPVNEFRNPVLNVTSPVVFYSQAAMPLAWTYMVYEGFHNKDEKKIQSATLVSLGIIAATTLNQTVKWAVKRERPIYKTGTHGDYQDPAFVENVLPTETWSMPSYSTTVAIFSARYYSEEWGHGWLWYTLAGLITWQRMYVGAHYPTDLLAGGLLGYGIAEGALYMKKKSDWPGTGKWLVHSGGNSLLVSYKF